MLTAMEEKVSDFLLLAHSSLQTAYLTLAGTQTFILWRGSADTYSVVYHILSSRIIVDVDCDAAQCCDLCTQLAQAVVVLRLAIVRLAVHPGD